MIVLAFVLSFVLLVITALHVYWGIGGIWPGKDAASCAHAVVGFRGVDEMPAPFACFAVAACLALATLWPMALEGVFASPFPGQGLAATALLIGLVFLGRGIAGFTPRWRRLAPEQPFARLDRSLYSPLCLLIGLGFAVLAITEFPT
ncbi:DUF3995 domain-containing protein [Mesorhizobium sp. B2-2-4]|uniref:DUF3995 domain-containing protein n=1 Tax=unclassified Mesorhizobium TaxID=325217 RepID=UPI00112938B3|nr:MULTISPECIES: DUF3995 domain-containing protein [unclassified Mesorhizobium]MBZ9893609.1 DUF3995 domain-containing protein [Mesorhizobium sp. BR1-1-6]MBZ9979937.1 DUF3995 domain-containing protein [Mesorhizobium sp. BR-1-1-8]TPK41161.1 DUF3995 domain-containing protein [Mesorhizobium sp. B2-5-3]TPL19614.1 DUF3995 domain-containing protein [Mesorhizobium sp. B2-4-10]TPL38349.1 DUF3995 domain-containing protein [Mesorhizobium sp. B2-4-8]